MDGPLTSPRFGRRAAAAAALAAANEALNDLPATPDELQQERARMERVAREHADRRREAEQKSDRLASQVQQLYAELQRKDREIATVRRAKLDVEQRWRAAEVERARASVGKGAPADDLEAVIQAVAMAADAGPRFQDELRQFVHDKREERRIALVRDKIRNENPFALKQTTASREEILRRVRDCVYRKGREIRSVFRIIDEDKSGEVTSAQRYACVCI